MDLLTIALIALAAWMGILVVVVAMCRVAARADVGSAPTRFQPAAPSAAIARERSAVAARARALTLVG
jgi:hypothetical protein